MKRIFVIFLLLTLCAACASAEWPPLAPGRDVSPEDQDLYVSLEAAFESLTDRESFLVEVAPKRGDEDAELVYSQLSFATDADEGHLYQSGCLYTQGIDVDQMLDFPGMVDLYEQTMQSLNGYLSQNGWEGILPYRSVFADGTGDGPRLAVPDPVTVTNEAGEVIAEAAIAAVLEGVAGGDVEEYLAIRFLTGGSELFVLFGDPDEINMVRGLVPALEYAIEDDGGQMVREEEEEEDEDGFPMYSYDDIDDEATDEDEEPRQRHSYDYDDDEDEGKRFNMIPDENGVIGHLYIKTFANVREKPNQYSKKVGKVDETKTYKLLGIAENGWYHIRLKNGVEGYMSSKPKFSERID